MRRSGQEDWLPSSVAPLAPRPNGNSYDRGLACAGCGNHPLKMSCQRQQSFGAAGGFEGLLLGELAGQHRDIFDDADKSRFLASLGQGPSSLRSMASFYQNQCT